VDRNKEKFKKDFKARIYLFILRLLKFIDTLPKESVCRIIGDQLIRSGTSIGANYVEAQASSSKKDFTNFLHYSLKSCNESKFWLALLRDLRKGDLKEITCLLQELNEIANIFGSSLLTLKGKKKF
jgi:four helix bundle protein